MQCCDKALAGRLGGFSSGPGFYSGVALSKCLLYFSTVLLGVQQYNLQGLTMILRIFLPILLASADTAKVSC